MGRRSIAQEMLGREFSRRTRWYAGGLAPENEVYFAERDDGSQGFSGGNVGSEV